MVEGRQAARPLVNDIDPNRPKPAKRPITDPLEKTLDDAEDMALAPQTPQPVQQSIQPAGDFEVVKKIADSVGADVGVKIDKSLMSRLKNDPNKYVEVRSNPELYEKFLSSRIQSVPVDAGQPAAPKTAGRPISMPAVQAEPPRPRIDQSQLKRQR